MNPDQEQAGKCSAMREMTVGEYLDGEIAKHSRRADALRMLRNSLSIDFLQRGAFPVSTLLER